MLSISDLPTDEGFVPAGKWIVQLRDSLNDSLAGCVFVDGQTLEPIGGAMLKRILCFQPVIAIRRVEGEPFEAGDCAAFGDAPKVVEPEPALAEEPVSGTADTEPEPAVITRNEERKRK